MDEVLRRLDLDHLVENFKEQKISPDIVWILSSQDLEILCITSKQDVMSLRIACLKCYCDEIFIFVFFPLLLRIAVKKFSRKILAR